jgi:hypothetical protein
MNVPVLDAPQMQYNFDDLVSYKTYSNNWDTRQKKYIVAAETKMWAIYGWKTQDMNLLK